jgi:signal transduction histidine kinase
MRRGAAVPTARISRSAATAQMVGRVVVPAAIIIALIIWSRVAPHPAPQSPPGSGLVLTLLTVGLALVASDTRYHLNVRNRTDVTLPDPLYLLYFATYVLIGATVALPLAALTPFAVAAADLLRHRTAASTNYLCDILRESAAAITTTFFAGALYTHLTPLLASGLGLLRAEVVAALAASVVGFAAVLLLRTLGQASLGGGFFHACARTLVTPAMRFQALLFTIGPLLPIANMLDDIEAEFAWILFLIPLGVTYYLALVSVRLEMRTGELQTTVEQLVQARQREAELTGYATLITQAQEDERRRLARELHDDTAQALIALSRGLESLSTRPVDPPLSPRDAQFIHELTGLATRSLESVRRACQDLRPSVLDDLGLSAALASLAEATTRQGLACTFEESGEQGTYAPELEVAVYRIAQEALSNVRRHSGAKSAAIHITYTAGMLDLEVRDNGSGFDVKEVLRDGDRGSDTTHEAAGTPRRGLGLLGMRERAAIVGARLQIEPVIPRGTRVSLRVPLRVDVDGSYAVPAFPGVRL